jgi:hypothetical protein
MKQLYKHNDKYYIIHRSISISLFTNKEGIVDLEGVKIWRDGLSKVDHVLRDNLNFLFVETIQDVEIEDEYNKDDEDLQEV